MIIDSIETYYVILPLIEPWRTAYGEDSAIHSVLVRMTSGDAEGWGEACPFYAPTYSPETATSVYFLISELFAPLLVSANIDSAENLLVHLQHLKGNPFAKGGIESAWWTLNSVIEGRPLHELLGGTFRKVHGGADFGVQASYDTLLERIEVARNEGYRRIKLKVRPGWDLEVIRLVRSTYPRLPFHIDCNSGYTLDDLNFFKSIDTLGLTMIEQPLHHRDLFDHAKLQRQLDTPICLDESIKSPRDFELALRLGSCRFLNIKYARVGGLTNAVKLHNMAMDAGIPCWVGGMLESAIGSSISIELATLPNFTYPNDIFESSRFYRQDLTDPEISINGDCTFTPSQTAGLPTTPILSRIKNAVIRESVVSRMRY